MQTIKHDNIIYVQIICPIGGVETYVYELVRKYKDKDIAVVCKSIDLKQKARIEKYCKVYIHTNQRIECKVLITNYDTSIIDFVNPEAKIYTGVHSDYSHPTQKGAIPKDDPRITYLCITEDSKKKFEDITGIKDRTILCRNPLYLEKQEKPLVLMSATRLTPEKGGDRMLQIANELDRRKINYIWFIFTTDRYPTHILWSNKNVIKMESRLDLDYFYSLIDWYVQVSDCEGDSYSIKEALYRGKPIITCELGYYKEYGIQDNVNALFLEKDCSNLESVINRMTKPLKFNFKHIEDGYDKIIVDGKSHYEEDRRKVVQVKATINFTDIEANCKRKLGEIWECSKERGETLKDANVVEIISEIEEPKVYEAKVTDEVIEKPFVEKKETKKRTTKKVK